MRKLVTSFATTVATLTVVLTAVTLFGQSSALPGTWKLNVTKSKYSPGPAPKSQTLKWERIEGGFKFSTDTVNAQGQATHTETMEKDDGSEAPVQGAQTPTTRFLRRINDRTYEDGDKVNGKATVNRRVVISQDGKTLTVTMKGTNAQGQVVNTVAVLEKQ
jgi:hypothetical protein